MRKKKTNPKPFLVWNVRFSLIPANFPRGWAPAVPRCAPGQSHYQGPTLHAQKHFKKQILLLKKYPSLAFLWFFNKFWGPGAPLLSLTPKPASPRRHQRFFSLCKLCFPKPWWTDPPNLFLLPVKCHNFHWEQVPAGAGMSVLVTLPKKKNNQEQETSGSGTVSLQNSPPKWLFQLLK